MLLRKLRIRDAIYENIKRATKITEKISNRLFKLVVNTGRLSWFLPYSDRLGFNIYNEFFPFLSG